MLSNNQEAFLAMLRAGLWEQKVRLSKSEDIDFYVISRLAEEQAVVGLIAAGIEHLEDVKVPQGLVLQLVGTTLQIEKQNTSMNTFIATLMEKVSSEGIYALLVKGQGVAQCYERPLWRTSGDVDLVMDELNYEAAKSYFKTICHEEGIEINNRLHIDYTIGSWVVELHGSLRNGLWDRMDKGIDQALHNSLSSENERLWNCNGTAIRLPLVDDDIIFVFTHILQHFFRNGIGMRQICDWCRLIWKYKDSLNHSLLESRIRNMRILTEWRAFAALAVYHLGMPKEYMPLFDSSLKYKNKGDRILSLIFHTGNLGHSRGLDYYKKYPNSIAKIISLYKNSQYSIKQIGIFPVDSIRGWWKMIVTGIYFLVRKIRMIKKHRDRFSVS